MFDVELDAVANGSLDGVVAGQLAVVFQQQAVGHQRHLVAAAAEDLVAGAAIYDGRRVAGQQVEEAELQVEAVERSWPAAEVDVDAVVDQRRVAAGGVAFADGDTFTCRLPDLQTVQTAVFNITINRKIPNNYNRILKQNEFVIYNENCHNNENDTKMTRK